MDITDARIATLLSLAKRVTSKGRLSVEGKHSRRDYKLVGLYEDEEFTVFYRKHVEMEDDFSAGLIWHARTGESIILMRCNGASHRHTNQIEGSSFAAGNFHVHTATERYVLSGRIAEHYAEITAKYSTAAGALSQLCILGNISGLGVPLDNGDLF